MENFATSSIASTTCEYFYDALTGDMASSTCLSITSDGIGTSTPLELSTDPVLAVIFAAGLMVLSAMYVRRVFFS